jgi:DHA3 family macrolide efflux protein-like MFS transporter
LFGSRVAQFALVWWLTDSTGSATVLATATLVALIPEIALGPIAGAFVDRWSRRLVMIIADSLIALASLWLAAMFWMDAAQIWHIYAIMLVRALGGSFHWPAMQASTTLMVPKDQLTRVAGLNQTLNGVLNIVGPPLGALLMGLLPLHSIMLVDVSTAGLAIVPLFFVRIPQPKREISPMEGVKKPSIWADMRVGLRYLWGWSGIVILIAMAMVFKIASTPAFSLLPLLVRSHFHGDAAQLSLLEALFGAGVVSGGILLTVWGGFRRKIYTAMMGMIVFSLSFMGLGLAPGHRFSIAVGCALVMGFVVPMIDGPIMAIMQSTVAPEMQGRVFTLMGSFLWLTSPLGLAVAGPISDRLGLQMWYIVAGVLSGVMGIAGFFIPAIVNIEEYGTAQPEKKAELTPSDASFEEGAAPF